MKYFSINLTKDVQGLYTENYKTILKEIIEYLHNWRYITYP